MPMPLGTGPQLLSWPEWLFLPHDSSPPQERRQEGGSLPSPTTLRGSPAPDSGHTVCGFEKEKMKDVRQLFLAKASRYSHYPPRPEL